MIRNENGINFDIGYPLSDDDFHLLYVDINTDQHQRFIDWIKDDKAAPLLICGQIGTGKTTFIEKGFFEIDNQKSPFDIKFLFDTDTLFHFEGEYWGLFLGKIIDLADRLKVDISSFKLAEDILGIGCSDNDLKEQLLREAISISEIKKQKDVFIKVGNLVAELIPLIKKIISKIENKNGRKLFICAEGIDKFKYNETAYPFLQGILDFMADYKTLYEVNFVHLFFGNDKWRKADAIILYNTGIQEVEVVLQKRLGDRYKNYYSGIIPVIAGMSGGNLRQGLKILTEYYYAVEVLKKTADQAFSYACSHTRNNSLFIAREKFPSDIIKAVYRDRYLLTEMIRGDQKDSVHDALYNNWIMITGEFKDKKQWESMINPLITPASDIITDLPESPEATLLKSWAKEHETSPFGLEINKDIKAGIEPEDKIEAAATLSKTRIFDIIDSESFGMNAFNIIDLFERLAAYFLEEKCKDKIIIAYDDPEIAEIANDFIVGKAATYKPVACKDIFLENPTAKDIFTEIRNNEDKFTALSIFFGNRLAGNDVLILNKLRDSFIQNRMIWWIKFDDLRGYLEKWTQLQQFFLIYKFDENLLAWITKEEVLEDLKEIDDSDSDEMKNRLKKVLHYLEGKKNG